MNYYQLTTGLDDSDSGEDDVSTRFNDREALQQNVMKNDEKHVTTPQEPLQHAVTKCLSANTIEDINREYAKNINGQQEVKEQVSGNEVVLRRKKSSNNQNKSSNYTHRASQRFSRLLEGVSSLVPSFSGPRHSEKNEEPRPEDNNVEENLSLPYWVEATQNIQKVDVF